MGDMYDLAKRFSDAESASESEDNTPPKQNNDRIGLRFPAKDYTSEEIAQRLDGYIAVPRSLWGKIPKCSHIRYTKKDGAFKPGGFVHTYTIKDDGRKILQLKNSFDNKKANFAEWPLDLSTVKMLYKKIYPAAHVEVMMIKQMLQTHNEEIQKLKEENAQIKRLLQTAVGKR